MDVDQFQPESLDLSENSVQRGLVLEGTVQDRLDPQFADSEVKPLKL
jgi:hypothetical protein